MYALREVIAAALDEQLISKSADIEIAKDRHGDWRVHDFGRGSRIEHFPLNENQEKLTALAGITGKFLVCLKDTVASFHRWGITVQIRSSFGTFRLRKGIKRGFSNILTLHVEYNGVRNYMQGADFCLRGVTDADMANSKSPFLKFAKEEMLESEASARSCADRAAQPGFTFWAS